jgi:crotonobetainyl-CoA:carnitine CoA-transferase CaiB-like acyl-CoA transferase
VPAPPPSTAAEALGRRIEAASAAWGSPVRRDWAGVLGQRAALEGLAPRGRTSWGGRTHLVRCADGWVAVSLARPAEVEVVPAWLALAGGGDAAAAWDPGDLDLGDPDERLWSLVAAAVRDRPGGALADAAAIVGLPVGVLGERAPDPDGGVVVTRPDPGPVRTPTPAAGRRRPLVVDLSALWAGPLCAALLGAAGADVVKVESTTRPDASRTGSPHLYRALNEGKRPVALDLASAPGRTELAELVAEADVVVESSRPRALEQLGIVAARELARPHGPRVWVSITGHGRTSPRVAFGDDAAVAGGLVVHDVAIDGEVGPAFCGDAVADPLAGLAAAATALELLAAGERALVDVALAGVAAAAR